MSDEQRNRLGGMALANGLLVHGRTHWAAAVRDVDGRTIVASGRKPQLARGPLAEIPLLRGVLRLAEAMAVVPAARTAVPEARLALEGRGVLAATAGSAALTALARRRIPSVLGQEAVAAGAGLLPALIALRASDAAVWHGVEHKSIAAYERGGAAEVAHNADHAKEHDRCGSNLVLPLLLTTVIGNTVLRKLMPRPTIAARLALSAACVGISVEAFAFAGRRPDHPVSRVIHRVGHALQSGFATKEPNEQDLAVGRAAMDELLRAEGAAGE